ncbi:plasma-membrane proton-efflux P-type ATPase [Methylocystis heyeri]|uniref:Plasma-membrane proton-efflux P-type ATPase n=1 Tax=Methylocystis heyeri TaxID=391905 RepID=A0A6B8KF63_9HYPH|nr:plasma-membrane proton-efflux P-type ATPase [Methylocystis heyeri]QGM45040.1 plasma-membrane proton-efflux P-type ATPase [Methylocystis heyeri]
MDTTASNPQGGAATGAQASPVSKIAQQLQALKASKEGLSSAEAATRLTQYGPNTIEEKSESKWHKLLAYFWGPLPFLIEAAAVISALRRDWPDFGVVTGLLAYNAVVGFWQDNKAANALAALKKGLAPHARVLRDANWVSIEAAGLAPGDIVSVAAGQIVPADIILIEGDYLSCDQAALTGESLPVSKKIGDDAYAGSIAKQGSMTGLVTATGAQTFFGRTAKLIGAAGAASHSQRAVTQVGDFLLVLAFLLGLILVVAQGYREVVAPHDWDWSRIGGILQYVLVLLIASIPVALPAVMSVTMAIGAYALSLHKAIVAKLSAIEELAGVDVLCSDKTGTLTQNKLTVEKPIPFGASTPEDVLFCAALATQRSSEDAIDLAVLAALKTPASLDGLVQKEFSPFDPVTKRTLATVVDRSGAVRHYAKGAPQAISALAAPDEQTLKRYQGEVAELAAKGERALGVARSDDGAHWVIVGLISLMDPPRPDAAATIAEAQKLGLNVKMVTGDDVAIGNQIAGRLGLGAHLLVAGDVFPEGAKAEALPRSVLEAVERADGFGRVFPEHKYEIVKALQAAGHIVAMTGDGVNDAPALKQADCGIAVSGATDAARGAAALILTAPGLSTIINAIRVSRQIFERIESYIYYRIAMTLDIMVTVVASIVLLDFQPVTAIMIVALALLDDIPIMTIAYDNAPDAPKPVRWNMPRIFTFASLMGTLSLAQTFGLLLIGTRWLIDAHLQAIMPLDPNQLQTVVFLQLAVGGHLLLFSVRTKSLLIFPAYPSPKLFWAIVATQIVAVLLCLFGFGVEAIPGRAIAGVWAYCLIWLVLADLVKLAYWRHVDRHERAMLTRRANLAA